MDVNIKQQLEILNRQVKELTGLYHQAAVKSGISDSEFWVWYTLFAMDEEHSQQDICDMWSLPKQTVNSVVANLVKKKFVLLEMVPGTHNRKIIRMTEAGKQYGEAVIQHILELEHRTIEKMSAQERQSCISLLGKYIRLLREEFNGESEAKWD